jgi:hypothetical protein
MSDTIVLLHGFATGSSWCPVAGLLVSSGAGVFTPDLLVYGRAVTCLDQILLDASSKRTSPLR